MQNLDSYRGLKLRHRYPSQTHFLAQFQRRGGRFWNEIEFVILDSIRGPVMDFFPVCLPAPTLSVRLWISRSSEEFLKVSRGAG